MIPDSVTLDDLDRSIVRALQVAPRGSFSHFADTLGTSEQTVARRYRRLRAAGVVRVTAVVNTEALGQSTWVVRIQCTPNGTAALAQALAKRQDIGWVSIGGGAAEVVCVARSRSAADREELLLGQLARTAPVLGISAAMMLHQFRAGRPDDWAGLAGALTSQQEEKLRSVAGSTDAAQTPVPPVGDRPRGSDIDDGDEAILHQMVLDGRSSYAQLGACAGMSEGRAARRLHLLLERGIAVVDVDLSSEALGWNVTAQLWMTTAPADLHACGTALAQLPDVTFAAAVTGPHNLTAVVVCRDHSALYRLVTEQVGAVPGIRTLEVSPRTRVVKQAGALVAQARLAT